MCKQDLESLIWLQVAYMSNCFFFCGLWPLNPYGKCFYSQHFLKKYHIGWIPRKVAMLYKILKRLDDGILLEGLFKPLMASGPAISAVFPV